MLMHVDKMYQVLPLLSGESQGTTLPMSHFALKTGRPRCYAKSPTVQDAIPGLNSHTAWGDREMRTAISCKKGSFIIVRLVLRS